MSETSLYLPTSLCLSIFKTLPCINISLLFCSLLFLFLSFPCLLSPLQSLLPVEAPGSMPEWDSLGSEAWSHPQVFPSLQYLGRSWGQQHQNWAVLSLDRVSVAFLWETFSPLPSKTHVQSPVQRQRFWWSRSVSPLSLSPAYPVVTATLLKVASRPVKQFKKWVIGAAGKWLWVESWPCRSLPKLNRSGRIFELRVCLYAVRVGSNSSQAERQTCVVKVRSQRSMQQELNWVCNVF